MTSSCVTWKCLSSTGPRSMLSFCIFFLFLHIAMSRYAYRIAGSGMCYTRSAEAIERAHAEHWSWRREG
jgi:hypothetical protein